jgi:aquaporin Z
MSLKKYIVEFIGTFFLVLTICMTSYSKVSADLQPLAVGVMLMVLVYSMGYLSGAQFNPAISLAIYLRGRINLKEMGFYWIAQILGAIAAAMITAVLISAKPPVGLIASTPQFFSMVPALIAEALGSFALTWVVLTVATSKALDGNNFYGLAIGFTVTALMYTLGSVSGSAFNPVVAIATCVAHLSTWNNLWIYMVGGLGGAALATMAFKYISGDE